MIAPLAKLMDWSALQRRWMCFEGVGARDAEAVPEFFAKAALEKAG